MERGYKFGLEDYRNDLDLRGIIAMLGLDAEVSDLDHRFEALLIDRDKRFGKARPPSPSGTSDILAMLARSSWKILRVKDLAPNIPISIDIR